MLKSIFHPLSLILIFTSVCFSQQESLLLGPGDQISVKVFDTPEMDQQPRVTDSGTVPLLFIGDVKVAGLTPGNAAKAIEAALIGKQYMLHPRVQVTVSEYGTQQVSIMGQVRDPGTYDMTAGMPILSVLSMAGGLTDLADRHITIKHHGDNGTRVSYYFSNGTEEALDNEITVFPGDTVLVPKVALVYVIGDVLKPGGYPINTNDSRISALQAIAMAGYTNKTASINKTKLIRKSKTGSQEIPLQLADMQHGSIPDFSLQPDDVVFVPFSWMKNMIISSSSILSTTAGAAIYVGGR